MNAELATEQPKVVVLLAILWCLARMYEALDFAAIKREAELLRARKEGMLEFRNALLGSSRA